MFTSEWQIHTYRNTNAAKILEVSQMLYYIWELSSVVFKNTHLAVFFSSSLPSCVLSVHFLQIIHYLIARQHEHEPTIRSLQIEKPKSKNYGRWDYSISIRLWILGIVAPLQKHMKPSWKDSTCLCIYVMRFILFKWYSYIYMQSQILFIPGSGT